MTQENGELVRSLGFWECFSIAAGTMLGAGIFVFPGLAVAEAGPAAVISFLIAGLVALLVALPASELATAFPKSGGGYVYVADALGRFWGAVVGLAQWLGLIFASSFYLVGFGHYLNDFLSRLGVSLSIEINLTAFLATALLFGVSLVGTGTAGKLQNQIVLILLAILLIFLGGGLLHSLGWIGEPHSLQERFFAEPTLAIFTTSALIFTSYLGFAQVLNVAGEVRDPGRTIPGAMISSILLVTLIYAATVYLSTLVLGTEAMTELGETAIPEVGKQLFGVAGGIGLVLAGLLATLSSANASVLGSSRLVFALSKDGVLPEPAGRVNRRFSTPHISLLMVVLPMALLVWVGPLELLAEVASLVHLILYGLLGICVIALRKNTAPEDYNPDFRMPFGLLFPALTFLAALALIALMDRSSQITGALLLLTAAGWYALISSTSILSLFSAPSSPEPPGTDSPPEEPIMKLVSHLPASRLLIPLDIAAKQKLSVPLADLLSTLPVFLVGYWKVPEQSSPEQVREEHGEEAEAYLQEILDRVDQQADQIESQLIFTPDIAESIEELASKHQCDAILTLPGSDGFQEVRRILVCLQDDISFQRLEDFLVALLQNHQPALTLLFYSSEPDEKEKELLLQGLKGELDEQLLEEIQIDLDVISDSDITADILERTPDFDLLVMGRTAPPLLKKLFSKKDEKISRKARIPVIVVRHEQED